MFFLEGGGGGGRTPDGVWDGAWGYNLVSILTKNCRFEKVMWESHIVNFTLHLKSIPGQIELKKYTGHRPIT